jgi:hypothetical protein
MTTYMRRPFLRRHAHAAYPAREDEEPVRLDLLPTEAAPNTHLVGEWRLTVTELVETAPDEGDPADLRHPFRLA